MYGCCFSYDRSPVMQRKILIKYSSIQYNCLNLPSKVIFKDGSTIAYIYGADGTKLRTVHQIGGTTTITEYCGNVIYENDTAKRLLTEVGYITLSDKKSHYYLQDHQGNNRVVLNESGSVEEVNHYYPFGGLYANSTNVQSYTYNGKELDTKKGLNWYDYGARMYDAALGRWHTVDPLAENYYRVAPYVYCDNLPVRYIDTDGRKIVDTKGDVIYTKDGGWIPNASQDAQRIGNAMMQTRTGTIQFEKLVNADHDITLSISPEVKIERGNNRSRYRLGTSIKHFVGDKLSSVDIIIFEGTLNEFANVNTSKAKKYKVSTNNNDEAIGAIAVHESVHATDEQNIKESKENVTDGTLHDIEKTPNEAERNVLRELFNQHNEF